MHMILLKIKLWLWIKSRYKIVIACCDSCMCAEGKERINDNFDIWRDYSIIHKGGERKSGA